MSGALVVGYDGSDQAGDALALGRLLAPPLEAELAIACVYPHGFSTVYVGDRALEAQLRVAAERQLAAAPGADELRREAVVAESPARGLIDVAERRQARLLVVGASHRGGVGELLLGSVGRSLLHGAPCPVAVVPRGFSRRPSPDGVRVVGVAFDGSPESELALAEAILLADALDARVRLVGVAHSTELFPDPSWLGLGDKRYANVLHERRRHELDRGSATVPERLRGSSVLVVGDPAHALRRQAERGMGLLVMGSRGYGPLRRVLLGSVAAGLLHASPCPVIVCPRGSEEEALPQPA